MSDAYRYAYKSSLCSVYTAFFRDLDIGRLKRLQSWLHPDLYGLVQKECDRVGERNFLREMRAELGSSNQYLRLGRSSSYGHRGIESELLDRSGIAAGFVRFFLVDDGWRIYALEVWRERRRKAG